MAALPSIHRIGLPRTSRIGSDTRTDRRRAGSHLQAERRYQRARHLSGALRFIQPAYKVDISSLTFRAGSCRERTAVLLSIRSSALESPDQSWTLRTDPAASWRSSSSRTKISASASSFRSRSLNSRGIEACPLCRVQRRRLQKTCNLYRTAARQCDRRPAISCRDDAATRRGREQRDGAVSTHDRRHAMIARQDNENLYLILTPSDLYRWGRRSQGDSEAGISLGVRADRQLRIAHRTRRRLAVAADRMASARSAKYSIGAALLGQRTSPLQSACALARTAAAAGAVRARRATFPTSPIPAGRCGVTTQIIFALCGVGYFLQFRDHQDFGLAAGDAQLKVNRETQYLAVLDDCPTGPRGHR